LYWEDSELRRVRARVLNHASGVLSMAWVLCEAGADQDRILRLARMELARSPLPGDSFEAEHVVAADERDRVLHDLDLVLAGGQPDAPLAWLRERLDALASRLTPPRRAMLL